MTSCKENAAGCLADPDEVAGSGCAQDAILTDEQLLHAVSTADLCDKLCDLGIPVAAIATNDEERTIDALGNG